MTQLLAAIFKELGISQYLDAFLEQGFDTWETILDITESDLDALGVKLGHRRKLQRRIANFRGIAPETSLVSPIHPSAEDQRAHDGVKAESPRLEGREVVSVVVTKRKYRRHPKPDPNAPERPPSAYVLFSNKMREDLKDRNLNFAEIAKLVGEKWQNLSPAEKEPFESRAQAIKDKYLKDLAEYKKTPQYRDYQAYLHEFRLKHGSPSQDKDGSKRLRVAESGSQSHVSSRETPARRTSRSGSVPESRKGSEPPVGRQRVDSTASAPASQYTPSLHPSTLIGSIEEPIHPPTPVEVEQHAADRSPTCDTSVRDRLFLSGSRNSSQGDEQATERLSVQRQLPSLSDMLDTRTIPGGPRPETNGFQYPVNHVSGNMAFPPVRGGGDTLHSMPIKREQESFAGVASSNQAFSHQSRAPADGSLPIHALLDSNPEPAFEARPPSHPAHSYHVDQESRLVHQTPNGTTGLPAINAYRSGHPLSLHPLDTRSSNPESSQAAQRTPPLPSVAPPPQHGKHGSTNFDGMSALLRAGEIVDRRTR